MNIDTPQDIDRAFAYLRTIVIMVLIGGCTCAVLEKQNRIIEQLNRIEQRINAKP